MTEYRFVILRKNSDLHVVVDTLDLTVRYIGKDVGQYIAELEERLKTAEGEEKEELQWEISDLKAQLGA